MDITMQQARESNLKLIVTFETAEGDLADIHGAHHASSSNPEMASVRSLDDSTQAHEVIYELHPVAGLVTLSGFADADLGAGERMLAWSFDLMIEEDIVEAQSVKVSAGQLVPKEVA